MSSRFVIDTNTIVSAALFRQSVPRQAVDAALAGGIVLVSDATTLELTSVLLRSKFDRYLSSDVRERFLTVFLQQTALIEIIEPITACRDPKQGRGSLANVTLSEAKGPDRDSSLRSE
ncbi:putative toxin-antitoxin system toxin component, PIN family [Oscillochloris sp. ZM17-4]|uniref:putative toxin-antitoxin system toxin component, PIN family n=1 Tax=Oscillochloris sp. ZM17-4 TaxID=2866714 RepID=UPI001C73A7BF|nr:putative toxin-antitoxin system toxin component, PIN family [Oscillochloris sp. ZM17-4]MBX0328150.1 putative toxin-antitoxin system toxin component, PIN family [Oscillochloris sp. ZM17-4]